MVTFSIPGDNELAEAGKSTPRPRPALPFARRGYVSTPLKNSRLGVPQSAPSRRMLTTRDEQPTSSLNRSTISTARNIFRASTTDKSVRSWRYPRAESRLSRVDRAGYPRGMAAKTTSKDLFHMRIADPDPELSGEVLTRKIPQDWNNKGSIYADQFLSHLCPTEFDDEQQRQFFCILDLRRLKYAANEIFSQKDWKLNVINFAKEFEKSRSIILLRYGLYEFQNVKPSKDVLKRWRREHGLPEPEEDNGEPTPTKVTAAKKRKADDEDTDMKDSSTNSKRRAPEHEEDVQEQQAPAPAPVPVPASTLGKNKRRSSISDEADSQPSKMQKGQASAAKSLFEKIANKSSTTPVSSPLKPSAKPADDNAASKPNPFAFNKTNGSGSSLARSIFQNPKPTSTAGASGGNIFGYLSDASSAKNSGVDADAESEADSDAEDDSQGDEPSAAASGAETASQVGNGLFGQKTALSSGLAAGSSAPGTRESTPGPSLFDRVTKDTDGQPVRLEDKAEVPAEKPFPKLADQTWNPSTTPIKFAPSVPASTGQAASLFGNATSAPTSSLFANKPAATSNLFGAAKPAEKASTPSDHADKTGGDESDKENDEAPKKSMFESKASAAQPSFGSMFSKPATEAAKAPEPAKPVTSLFGAKPDDKASTPAPTANLFGAVSKPAESSGPVMQSSTLFGAKSTGDDKPAATEAPKTSLFGAPSTSAANGESTTVTSLFGAKPTTTASNLFGNTSTPAAAPLFGAPSSSDATAAKKDTPATTSMFSFGGASNGADKINASVWCAPIPKPSSGTAGLDGSPMKQDEPSPAKRAFNGGTVSGASAPIFSFGGSTTPAAAPPSFSGGASGTSTPLFGGASTTPAANDVGASFGSNSSASGSFGFQFGGGGGGGNSTSSSFNNPFASGNNGGDSGAAPSSSGGMFSFGASSAPSAPSGGAAPFQFGGPSNATAFGANNSTPTFGGASGSSGAPGFSFTGASPAQNATPTFGSNQSAPAFGNGNLQPPAGGSTTGTTAGTPEPSTQAEGTARGDDEGEKHEQVNLAENLEQDEDVVHDVRAKVLKFVPAGDKSDDKKPKSQSPWSTQGVGALRLLKHKETNIVRLLLRAEPRGHIAMNRAVLPDMSYKADKKYVKMTTSNEKGDGLETWMIQVKTADMAKELAEALEKNKNIVGGAQADKIDLIT
ncbi:Nucleoporin [Fusarium culmorum]|uniref:Nucleoporin n=1 Tax=Fusarium culmorum TaxID=5516 RepID=A0A2T4GI86_FUSCU|nr:Nucleoporin [Fusarium culmorum]